MERLTKCDEFGNADIIGVDSADLQCNLKFDEFNKVTSALNRLAEYEDLHEKGRLRIFPCYIGDIVYRIHIGEQSTIVKMQVLNFKIFNNDLVDNFKMECADEFDGGYSYRTTDIGRYVFITREAAENALKAGLWKNDK